jgi:glycosyltransferase involved in cell wall biosynthesis
MIRETVLFKPPKKKQLGDVIVKAPVKSIVYVGPFAYPQGGAAARRILGVSKSLQHAGCSVKIGCGQMAPLGVPHVTVDGIEVTYLNERTSEHLPNILKHLRYINMGKKTVKWLDSLTVKPDAVILYSGYSPYLLRLSRWCQLNDIPLIFDAVEWYDPATSIGFLSPYQLNIELAMRFLIPRVGRVISISSFLDKYFQEHNCRSLVIPPTLDIHRVSERSITNRTQEKEIKLVYAGTPGRKDSLGEILDAVVSLREEGYPLTLKIAGVSREEAGQYLKSINNNDHDLEAVVQFVGVLSHQRSLDLVRSSDYSLLLRQDARFSKAGFPTKFVESFAVGTPVIANLTSDLNLYLKDGMTGFISNGSSSNELKLALLRAAKISNQDYLSMRAQCRDIAAKSFDYRLYSESLINIIQ